MNNSADQPTSISKKNNIGGEAYLRVQVDRHTPAAIPMEYAREVLVVPTKRITPIPNMSTCVLGLLNQRSRVFWVVNLSQILELSLQEKHGQQYHIAIVRVNNIPLGLLVNQVKGTIHLDPDTVQSPLDTVSSHLIPYVRGCVALETEVILILDLQAIINAPILHENSY